MLYILNVPSHVVDNHRILSSTQLHENYCINPHGINNTGKSDKQTYNELTIISYMLFLGQEPVIVLSDSSSNSFSDALIWGLLSSSIFLLLMLLTFVIAISTLLIIRRSTKEKASVVVSK